MWTITHDVPTLEPVDNDAKSPSEVIGGVLRALRDHHGLSQDDVATSARTFGLRWTRATVAAVETGRRAVDLGEYFLLPVVLEHAVGFEVDLASLVPPASRVRLGPGAVASGAALAAAMGGRLLDALDEVTTPGSTSAATGFREAVKTAHRVWPAARPADMVAAERDSAQLVEARCAARLGISPFEAALAARRLWGRSMTEERNSRLAGGGNAATARAHAGHVTRSLTAELRAALVKED